MFSVANNPTVLQWGNRYVSYGSHIVDYYGGVKMIEQDLYIDENFKNIIVNSKSTFQKDFLDRYKFSNLPRYSVLFMYANICDLPTLVSLLLSSETLEQQHLLPP